MESFYGTLKAEFIRKHRFSTDEELNKATMEYVSATTKRTLKGNFRTRADSIISDKTKLSGGRKKYNEKLIEM